MARNSEYRLAKARLAMAALASLSGLVAAGAHGEQALDMATLCGEKPVRVALIDGNGGDNWRKTTRLELEAEAAKCANIGEILYFDAAGDQLKYNLAISNYVAQGVDVILAFAEFGESSLPAFRDAFSAGVTMVPYYVKVAGTPGQDYTTNVYQDQGAVGQAWGRWLSDNIRTGNVVFLGGVPGAAPSQQFFAGLKAGIADAPDIKLLEPDYVVTNWNPADAQKATAGLIAKYPQIDIVVTDYGVTALAAVKAFEQAGLPVPAIATVSSNNEINCKYLADRAAGNGWKYFTLDYTTGLVRTALRRAVSIFEGTPNDEAVSVVPPVYADSENGIDPKCDPGAPPDADLSSTLPEDQLKVLFNQ